MARTMTNVTAAAASATVVARQTGLLDDEIFAGRAEFQEADDATTVTEPGRRLVPDRDAPTDITDPRHIADDPSAGARELTNA